MAEETRSREYQAAEGAVETQDRGMLDFLGKKEEEKPKEEVIASEFKEKAHVSEPQPKKEGDHDEKKHGGLLEKLHRSDSSSSSSSDEEEGEGEEKKKKKKKEKKELKDKIKEKISGEKGDEEKKHEDTAVPVEKVDEVAQQPEEKKGFLEKIKEKLPGHKKADEVAAPPPPPPPPSTEAASTEAHEGEAKEKKGILEKIKEKLPGYHPKTEEDKEKEKESASY